MTQDAAIEKFKAAFSHASESLHFNNAGIAPWPLMTLEAVRNWSDRLGAGGTHAIPSAFAESELTRSKLAQLIGTQPEQIAFFTTTATAISQVAFGYPLKRGDEIVVWDQEYPSNFHPWRMAAERVGAKLIVAKSEDGNLATPFANLEAVVTDKTRVIAVSWVQYRTGAITDLEALSAFARARGIFTCVDVIQGVGALPFNFEKLQLDAVCGGAHKWLTSPLSLGYLAMKSEHVDLLNPIMIGAMSYGGPDVLATLESKMVSGMAKYEPGGRQLLEMIGLGASLDLFLATGVDHIFLENERLAAKLMHGLREKGYTVHSPHESFYRGAICNFSPSAQSSCKTLEDIEAKLICARASFSRRPPGIRLAPHAFVTDAHVDRVLELL